HCPDLGAGATASIGQDQAVASAPPFPRLGRFGAPPNQSGGLLSLRKNPKKGDRSLRVLLIHGARTVVRWADKHSHPQSRWIRDLVARRGKNKAVVALANKLMRIVWVVRKRPVFPSSFVSPARAPRLAVFRQDSTAAARRLD